MGIDMREQSDRWEKCKLSNIDDLARADFWASMAFNPDAPDEELRHWFKEFSLRADKMLLDDWKDNNDGRMAEVKQIMYELLGYVPSAGDNTVWDIYSNATADNHRNATKIATIFLGKSSFNYELHVEDRPLKDMYLQKVYCALMRKG